MLQIDVCVCVCVFVECAHEAQRRSREARNMIACVRVRQDLVVLVRQDLVVLVRQDACAAI